MYASFEIEIFNPISTADTNKFFVHDAFLFFVIGREDPGTKSEHKKLQSKVGMARDPYR